MTYSHTKPDATGSSCNGPVRGDFKVGAIVCDACGWTSAARKTPITMEDRYSAPLPRDMGGTGRYPVVPEVTMADEEWIRLLDAQVRRGLEERAFTVYRARDVLASIDAGLFTWDEAVTQSKVPLGYSEEQVRDAVKRKLG